MTKQEILNDYKKPEDKMLLAQILDKIEFTKTKNKLQNTDFLDMYQVSLVEGFLRKNNIQNYKLVGGFEGAERKIALFYPEKYDDKMIQKNVTSILEIIRIKLPENLNGKYSHREYLGGVIKLGIKREKIGDILVDDTGADIIILNEISKFLLQNLSSLTRFSTSEIAKESIENLRKADIRIQEIKIIVSSLRLDNIVSELARCSRSKAEQILETERVFINGQNETKKTKQIKQGDIVTIRGKGRFEIKEFVGNTRSGRYVVLIEKYI